MSDMEEEESVAEAEPEQKKAKNKRKYGTTSSNALRGDVKQLYSREDFDGEPLPDDTWRCELCSLQHVGDLAACTHIAQQGNSNLVKHQLDSHGIQLLSKEAVKAKKKDAKLKKTAGTGSIVQAFNNPTLSTVKVEQIVGEYLISELLSFNHAERDAFQSLKRGLLGGKIVTGPSAKKVRKLLDMEAVRIQELMKKFIKDNMEEFSLSGDGKKCVIKGRPMYGISLHGVSKQFDLVLLPLLVGEPDGKTAEEVKRFVQRGLGMFELSLRDLVAFTGDEAEQALVQLLGCSFVKCGPHRLSTAFKRTFQALGLTSHGSNHGPYLLESTKSIVQFCVRRYRARKLADEYRAELNKLSQTDGRLALIGTFAEFSQTRFLGALKLGDKFVQNLPVLEKVNSYALRNAKEDPYHDWPEYKERFGEEWKDICFVSRDVSHVLESLSGELYPTLSTLIPAIKVLETHVWLTSHGQKTVAQPDGEPPLVRHGWSSSIGPKFALQLKGELAGKFESDWTNRVILVAALLDPRVRTFKFPIRRSSTIAEEWELYRQIFSTVSTRAYGDYGKERSISAWMFSSVMELMHARMPVQWEEEISKLDTVKQAQVRQGKYHVLPLWADLESWANARPETLLFQDQPITADTDPVLFWKQNTAWATLKPFARITLGIPASALSEERMWSASDKVWEKHRNKLEIATAGRQLFVQQTWRIARQMLARGDLSREGRAFYESLLPWGLKGSQTALGAPGKRE